MIQTLRNTALLLCLAPLASGCGWLYNGFGAYPPRVVSTEHSGSEVKLSHGQQLFVRLPQQETGAIQYVPQGLYTGNLMYVNWDFGEVRITFRTETFPLERFADSAAIQLLNRHARWTGDGKPAEPGAAATPATTTTPPTPGGEPA